MAGLGVASFGHVNGVHVQNKDTWETYSEAIDRGELPLARAYRPTDDERMRRELVLQMKLGRLRPAYFAEKYGVDILADFASAVRVAARRGLPHAGGRRRRDAVARGPAARRLAAAALLPPRTHEHPLHVMSEVEEVRESDVRGRRRQSVAGQRRRVQFSETDAAGIVHFSNFFRYFEDAEHALWRDSGPEHPSGRIRRSDGRAWRRRASTTGR